MPSASLLIAGIVAAIALLVVGLVVIFRPGDNTLIVGAIFGFALAIGTAALGVKQSVDNGAARIEDRKTIKAIDTKVDAAVVSVDTTRDHWNHELGEWKKAIEANAAKDRDLLLAQTKQLIAEALATGLARGRELAVQEAQDTAVAVVAASGPSADHLPADTVEVVASLPAVIKIVAPPAEQSP